MKALVLTAPEHMEITEMEKPVILGDEVLVRIGYCGICTLEQRLYSGAMKIYYPLIPGHEASGVVEDIGPEVISDIRPGMKVALDLVTRCNECYYCRTGKSNLCLNRFKKGRRILGGFAEYIAVKSSQIYVIPEDMDLKTAAFSEPVACCIRSLRQIQINIAEDLLIQGAGVMGLLHLQVARCMGARVFVSDINDHRLAMAERLGAAGTINPEREDLVGYLRDKTGGKGMDACVITSPAPACLETAIGSLSPHGRLNIYTSYGQKPGLPVDADTVHRQEFLITGTEGRTPDDFERSVRLLSFGMVKVEGLISGIVSPREIIDGMKTAMDGKEYRVLITPGKP